MDDFETPSNEKQPGELSNRLSFQATYSDLFMRLLDSAVLLDTETYAVLDVNDSCEQLLGSTLETLKGSRLGSFIAAEKQESFEKNMRVSRRRYYPREWDSLICIAGKPAVPVRITACNLKLNNGQEAIQVLIRDISKETEAQEKIRQYISELEVLNRKLESLSTTDEMTKLHNFRHFKAQLQLEHSRAHRYNGTYSVLFLDVDHFKHYNDTNGHQAGDDVLREIAKIVRTSCRDTDLPARYGGEEFVVLCPEVNWKNAMVLAERIREAVARRSFAGGPLQPMGKVTVSVGVASYPSDGSTADSVIEAADRALYYSKETGRNRSTPCNALRSEKQRAS